MFLFTLYYNIGVNGGILMKDYKLSELKEICSNNTICPKCPLCSLCEQLDNRIPLKDLEIDEEGDTNAE